MTQRLVVQLLHPDDVLDMYDGLEDFLTVHANEPAAMLAAALLAKALALMVGHEPSNKELHAFFLHVGAHVSNGFTN